MGKYNLWLEWESYKIRHPEARQVLEWQEQYYRGLNGLSQNGGDEEGKNKYGCIQKQTFWEDLQGG